jgi:hypothetical protein
MNFNKFLKNIVKHYFTMATIKVTNAQNKCRLQNKIVKVKEKIGEKYVHFLQLTDLF